MTNVANGLNGRWRVTTLGEIGEYINGRGFKKSEWSDAGRMIIRIQDLTGSGKAPNYFTGDCDEKHVVRGGDLLVSWAATLDAFVWKGPEAVLNQHIFKVSSRINRRLHYHLIKFVLDDIRARAHGSGMVHITKREFEDTKVAVPDSEADQAALADAIDQQLSRLEEAHADLVRADRRVQLHRRSLLDAAVWGRLASGPADAGPRQPGDRLPASWHWRSVGELARRVQYGTSERADGDALGVPVLRMGNVKQGRIDAANLKFLPPGHHEFPEMLLDDGDVLFNRTNSPELVGKSAVYRGEPSPCSFASYLIRITPGSELRSDYLVYVLNSSYGRGWIRTVVSQQVGQANVNGSKLKALQIPVPPLDQQDSLIADVERQSSVVEEAASAIAASRRRVQSLRRAVMSDALGGVPSS
jgi:type I restriction enzyme S subunit